MMRRLLLKFKGCHSAASGEEIVPRGSSVFSDIKRCMPDYVPGVVFDVGANVGQSAREFVKVFPGAKVYSIEPIPSVFAELQKNLQKFPQVTCLNLGCGSRPGRACFKVEPNRTMSRLERKEGGQDDARSGLVEDVEVATLDNLCRESGFGSVGFLKIDTEGGDLEVLRGASDLLARGAVDFVEVEAAMNCDNRYHVPMEELKQFLEACGYRLFGIYEQIPEWPTKQRHLRRANLVFISPGLSAASAG